MNRGGWSAHDHYNHECDREADRIYHEHRKWDVVREYGGEDGLQVWVDGCRLQGPLRARLKDHLALLKIKDYLGKSMGRGEVEEGETVEGEEVVVDGDGRRRWANKEVVSQLDWDLMSEAWGKGAWGAEAQAKASKLMHGWVATMRVLRRRNEVETEVCPCCGSQSESAFHLKMECTHDKMVEIRSSSISKMRDKIKEAIMQGGAGREMAEAVGRMWAVDDAGRMIRWEGMQYATAGGDWEAQVDSEMHVTDGGVASDSQVVVRDLMARMAHIQPADLREGWWMMKSWGLLWEEAGISRHAAAATSKAILKGLERMFEALWKCRNDIAHDKIDKHKYETREIWYQRIWDMQDGAGCRRTARDVLEIKKIKQLRMLDKDIRMRLDKEVRARQRGGPLERMGWLGTDSSWVRQRVRNRVQVPTAVAPPLRQRQLHQVVGTLEDAENCRQGAERAAEWDRRKRREQQQGHRRQGQQAVGSGRQRQMDIRWAMQVGEPEGEEGEESRGGAGDDAHHNNNSNSNALADSRAVDGTDMQQQVLNIQQSSSED